MGTYQGDATVIVGDATYDVVVDLKSKTPRSLVNHFAGSSPVTGSPVWGGTLETDDESAAVEMMRGEGVRIRLPDGSEGDITVDGTVGETLDVIGYGAPPF
ncbi:DUF4873 domain-containing protein [Streptomyces tibetensis]|uniref:DUF4873 domain-containing protein n=1 Tax=Streptomyces tibetensis TaxID=2382123 RepID=UPI0033DEDE99